MATRVSEDDSWNALHPASILVNVAPRAWGLVRGFWPFLLAAWFGGAPFGDAGTFIVGSALLAFGGAVVGAVVSQATLRWRLVEGRLEIRTGWLDQQVRVLAAGKVQNVESVQGILHRVFHVVEVRVETAAGSEVEGRLNALGEADAVALVARLLAARTAGPAEERAEVVVTNSWLDLVRYGMASGRLGAVALVFGGMAEWVQVRDPSALGADMVRFGGFGTVLLMLAALTTAWWAGIVFSLLTHHGFRLTRRGDALVAESGLFVRRRVDLSQRRIQSVHIRTPWLARRLGFSTVAVETAAAREGAGGVDKAEAVVPVVDDPSALLRHLVPGLEIDPLTATYLPASPRAIRRAVISSALSWTVIATAASFAVGGPAFALWAGPPVGAYLAWRGIRAAGWRLTEGHVLSRVGVLRKEVVVAPRSRIQAVHVRQGPWLRRLKLAVVEVRLAGSSMRLPVMEADEAVALASTLSSH